ncbi:type VI immunity family protein [Archangium sp.]|uniref:type VI immunity family protein n=1 Tax=Archangium sp. TaxID=1872627 RepID=UPI0039C85511
MSFWLPTEYLEEHGPGLTRELALELATPLPFCSGHAGLSFNCDTSLVGVEREVRKLCFRYPGMDIPDPSLLSYEIGTRVRGPGWLTFLGQPVLGELGGTAGLRSRLCHPIYGIITSPIREGGGWPGVAQCKAAHRGG